MIKRILIGIGGTPFTAVAIKRAVELARQHNSRLKAVTVVDPTQLCKLGPVPAGAGHYAKKMCENRIEVTHGQIEESIVSLREHCRQSGVDLSVEQETGDPFGLIINHARYHDLTIFGLRSIFDYRLVNEPEKDILRLLAKGVRPVLAVSDTFRRIERVMIAYNGSMESANAMQHFVQSGLWPDASLDIVHIGDGRESNQTLLEEAAAYCDDHGYAVNTHHHSGNAAEQLLPFSGQVNADMIVMGRSIRSMLVRRVLGDTVLKTLANADLPLFLSQ